MLQEINCCYTFSDRKVQFISIWTKLDEKDKGGLYRLPVCWGNTKRPSSRRKRNPVIQLLHKHSSIPTHPNMAENKLFQQNISCFPRLSYFVIEKTQCDSQSLDRVPELRFCQHFSVSPWTFWYVTLQYTTIYSIPFKILLVIKYKISTILYTQLKNCHLIK